MPRVWFITGCSSGFGRALAARVLARGDRLAATARDPATLAELVALGATAHRLDVTKPDEITAAVAEALTAHGRLDVVVNNAGAGLVGALEEYSEAQIAANLEVNLMGPIRVLRAVLPILRAQKSGHILNIGAIAGFCNDSGFSVYGGAKFALEGLSEALRGELAPLGIQVTVVEPGPFRTDFIGRSMQKGEAHLTDYDATSGKFARLLSSIDGKQSGDPVKAADAMIAAVEADKPPFRLPLGAYALKKVRDKLAAVAAEVDAWEAMTRPTDFSR